jgi:hypothetical protein
MSTNYNAFLKATMSAPTPIRLPFETEAELVEIVRKGQARFAIPAWDSLIGDSLLSFRRRYGLSLNSTFVEGSDSHSMCQQILADPSILLLNYVDGVNSLCDLSCVRQHRLPFFQRFGQGAQVRFTVRFSQAAANAASASARAQLNYARGLLDFVRTAWNANERTHYEYFHRCDQEPSAEDTIRKTSLIIYAALAKLSAGLLLSLSLYAAEICWEPAKSLIIPRH